MDDGLISCLFGVRQHRQICYVLYESLLALCSWYRFGMLVLVSRLFHVIHISYEY